MPLGNVSLTTLSTEPPGLQLVGARVPSAKATSFDRSHVGRRLVPDMKLTTTIATKRMMRSQRLRARGEGHRPHRTQMSRREFCRPHHVILLAGPEEQTAGLVYYPAALAQTLLHHRRGLGSRMKIVTGDDPIEPGRGLFQKMRGRWHMDTRKPRCAGYRRRLYLRIACRQTLISALSVCILVFIWDGRFQLDTLTLAQILFASVFIVPHSSLPPPLSLHYRLFWRCVDCLFNHHLFMGHGAGGTGQWHGRSIRSRAGTHSIHLTECEGCFTTWRGVFALRCHWMA